MTKNFSLQDNEKFWYFYNYKEKKASYYFDNVLHCVFKGFDNKSGLEFLILILIFKLFQR